MVKKYEEIVAYAENVFAITEYACEHLSKKHNKPVHLIPHTIDVELLNSIGEKKTLTKPKIHFAGGIHDVMNTDSVLQNG